MEVKTCKKCATSKDHSYFAKNKHRSDGYSDYCKSCQSAYHKKWRKKNTASIKIREAKWRQDNREKYLSCLARHRERTRSERVDAETGRRIGASKEEIKELREKHDGRCDICRTDKPGNKKKRMSIDHCHKTGKVRGLLCDICNRGLGLLKDDLEVLKSAIAYLERFACLLSTEAVSQYEDQTEK